MCYLFYNSEDLLSILWCMDIKHAYCVGVVFSYECDAAIVDNSTCVVRVYQIAVKAAEWYGFLSLVLSKALCQAGAAWLWEAVKSANLLWWPVVLIVCVISQYTWTSCRFHSFVNYKITRSSLSTAIIGVHLCIYCAIWQDETNAAIITIYKCYYI